MVRHNYDRQKDIGQSPASLLLNVDFGLRFARRRLDLELDLDAAEEVGANVVESDDDAGGDAAGQRRPECRRQHGTENIGRDDDIPELEEIIEQKEDDDGNNGAGRRNDCGNLDGGDESDAFECVGHGIVLLATRLFESCFVYEILNQGLHVQVQILKQLVKVAPLGYKPSIVGGEITQFLET